MPLNATIIKNRLDSVPSQLIDNEAQALINGATTGELKQLGLESIMRLYEALALNAPRIYSNHDRAAMKRLKTYTQFQPILNSPQFSVNLLNGAVARTSGPRVSADLVNKIYAAEGRRLAWYESIGIDGATIGRGQLGNAAYADVKSPQHYQQAFETILHWSCLAALLQNAPSRPSAKLNFDTYQVDVPTEYSGVKDFTGIEDFVVAAYLDIRIKAAIKAGRSDKDVLRFAVALYHGMRGMVVSAQTAVKDSINWNPVAAELIRLGHQDEVAYVNEVVV